MPLLNVAFFLALLAVYKAISIYVRKRLLATFTAVDDLPLLGKTRKDGQKISGTAVICGGRYVTHYISNPQMIWT
jgi:hypothetical protein